MRTRASYTSFFTDFLVNRMLLFVNGLSTSAATRIKRILFVFSVMRAIDAEHGGDPKTIRDINGRLHLSQNPEMCVASAAASGVIWKSADEVKFSDLPILTAATTPLEREFIATYFLRRCPNWLKYGDKNMSDMRRDIQKLFKVIVTRDCH